MADVYREPYAEDYIEPYNLIRSIALYDYIQGGTDKSGIFSSLEKVREGVDREEYNREYNRFAEKQRENRLVVLSSEVLGFRNDPHDITYNRVLSDEEVEAYRQDPVAFLERMYAELGNGGIQPSNFYGHSPSVGDCFVIMTPEETKAHYVASFGFEAEEDISKVMTAEQERMAIQGMNVRRERELLSDLRNGANNSNSREEDFADYVIGEIMGRSDELHDRYYVPINLATIREVSEKYQNQMKAVYEWETEHNVIAHELIAGEHDGVYGFSRDAIRSAMPDSRLANGEYVYEDIGIVAGRRIEARLHSQYNEINKDNVIVQSASHSHYKGMDIFTKDGQVFIGKELNYDNHGNYDNSDNSLQFVSDNEKMFSMLSGTGWVLSQQEMIDNGAFTAEDYKEYATVREQLASQYEQEEEPLFEIDIEEKGSGVPFRYPDWTQEISSFYRFEASPRSIGEQGNYDAFVQRYEPTENANAIPKEVVYIGTPRMAMEVANELNNPDSNRGELLKEDFALRSSLQEPVLQGGNISEDELQEDIYRLKALQNINDVSQYYVIGESLKKGNITRDVAEAIINGSGEIKANDTNRRFDFTAYEFFAEYLTDSAEKDSQITGAVITNTLHKFAEQTEVNNLKQFVEKSGGFPAFDPSREEKKETVVTMTEEEKTISEGVSLPSEKKDPKEQLQEQLQQGIKNVLDSDNFKSWLDTSSKLFLNNYSFNNAMLVYCQKPDATHTMGYEQWKEYGRNVAQGAKGIKIFVPIIAYEKKDGDLWKMIKGNLQKQMNENPSISQATYRVGLSKLEVTMNRNNLFGLKIDGKELGIRSENDMKNFIKNNVIGKVPMYFSIGTVFDAKDTVVPEYLWVKKGYKKEELVKDDKGKPIKNRRGEYKIVNTPERQARFNPHLDMSVPQKDPQKMAILYDALKAVSERNGIHVYEKDRAEDDTLKGGADGYFSRRFDAENPKGFIVMPKDLDPTRAVSVLLHEMSHSELHGNLEKLAQRMGEDNVPSHMREIQAESVAYVVGKNFGIDSDTSSFQYLASFSKGFELQALSKSIEVIYGECKQLTAELKSELEVRGLNMDLSERDAKPMDRETIDTLAKSYVTYAVEQDSRIADLEKDLTNIAEQNKDNGEALEVIVKQKESLDCQKEDVKVIKDAVTNMEQATTLEGQKKEIATIDTAVKRIEGAKETFATLTVELEKERQTEQGLKDRFTAEPLATLESMKESYPQLASLTSAQLQYVANSDYINRNFSSLLREEPQKFVDNVCQRATEIDKVTSKNGYFVEVNFCEQWTDKPIVNDGAIMHPKVADTIIKQGETQARGLKAKAEAVGEYFPYTKCSLSVFHAEKGNIDNVFKTRVDIGDGYQTSLVDHMKQISSASPILAGFEKATREQGAKEKIMFNSTHREEVVAEQTEKTGALSDRAMSREEWGNEIASAKQAEVNNSREDNEPQKNTRSKTEMEKG